MDYISAWQRNAGSCGKKILYQRLDQITHTSGDKVSEDGGQEQWLAACLQGEICCRVRLPETADWDKNVCFLERSGIYGAYY